MSNNAKRQEFAQVEKSPINYLRNKGQNMHYKKNALIKEEICAMSLIWFIAEYNHCKQKKHVLIDTLTLKGSQGFYLFNSCEDIVPTVIEMALRGNCLRTT